jgi:Fic family protein
MSQDITFRSGSWSTQPEGYQAFIPSSLPPELRLTMTDVKLAEQAGDALGGLKSWGKIAGGEIHDPFFFLQGFILQEAIASTRIEGIHTSMVDVMNYEIDVSEDEEEKSPEDSQSERALQGYNYVQALKYGLKGLETLPICTRLVLELHKLLLMGVRGDDKEPGVIRRSQNYIGGRGTTIETASFVPPPHLLVPQLLQDWERYINLENPVESKLVQCGLMHAQFEMIHPFKDGNGRVGRLLITLFLMEKGMQNIPLVYLSQYFEQNRNDYYRYLDGISRADKWEEWLRFFLAGIVETANSSSKTIEEIVKLKREVEAAIRSRKALSETHYKLIDYLFNRPLFTAKMLERDLEVSKGYANELIILLEDKHFIKEITGNKRNRRFLFHPYTSLLGHRG